MKGGRVAVLGFAAISLALWLRSQQETDDGDSGDGQAPEDAGDGAPNSGASSSSSSASGVDLSKPTSISLDDLERTFAAQVRQLIADMEFAGFPVFIAETYRSPERQAWLYEQGFSQIREGGAHPAGMAVDLTDGRTDSEGRTVHYGASLESWPNAAERSAMADEFFAALGQRAQALGLTWGGTWSFYDPAHVQSAFYA